MNTQSIFSPAVLFFSTLLISKPGHSENALDWVTVVGSDDKTNAACAGLYQEPSYPHQVDKEEIEVTGDSSQITEQTTIVRGNVEAIQGDRFLAGDKIILHKDKSLVEIEGNATLREPGLLIRGEYANIQTDNKTARIENAHYVLHQKHAHGQAKSIQRSKDEQIILEGGTYSYCDPTDPSWELRSQQLILDPTSGQGKGKHIRLAVLNVPVLYIPYIQFPLGDQRQSGFLAPSFAHGDDGLDFSLPYYFNLAPHYDFTIIPRYIADRGAQLGGEFRHLSPLFSSHIGVTYLPDDDITSEDRWLANLSQNGGNNKPWRSKIDITRVSDEEYFDDLDSSGLSVNRGTHLKQQGIASYYTTHWDLSLEALNYQTLRRSTINDPYKKLPEVIAKGSYITTSGFETNLDSRYAEFNHRDDSQTTGQRFYGKYNLSWNSPWRAGYINPGVAVQYLEQQLENPFAPDENHSVAIPAAYLSSGLFFDRHSDNYHQKFEPRLFYYYADYENQDNFQIFDTDDMTFSHSQLYRDFRFSGPDRIADANQTTVGFSTALFNNKDSSEIVRLSIGQIFYHEDRRISTFDSSTWPLLPKEFRARYTENQSPVASELTYKINPQWQLYSSLIWNEKQDHTESGSIYFHYQSDKNKVFSIGYRHRRQLILFNSVYSVEVIREGDISMALPLSNRWALASRINYDFNFNRTLEGLAGIEYNACCWRARLAYKKWAEDTPNPATFEDYDPREGIYFEIEMKTLGGLGTKIENILKDSVDGYGED